jgi:hypothetical protein
VISSARAPDRGPRFAVAAGAPACNDAGMSSERGAQPPHRAIATGQHGPSMTDELMRLVVSQKAQHSKLCEVTCAFANAVVERSQQRR